MRARTTAASSAASRSNPTKLGGRADTRETAVAVDATAA